MVPESHIGGRGGWVIIYPHSKTMAILKIVQTFILLTVSKSCCSNNPAKYFCFVITVHRKLYPVSRIIAVPPPPPIIVSYAGRKTEKISATKNLLKRDLGFTFPFLFWICFLGFVLFVFFFHFFPLWIRLQIRLCKITQFFAWWPTNFNFTDSELSQPRSHLVGYNKWPLFL